MTLASSAGPQTHGRVACVADIPPVPRNAADILTAALFGTAARATTAGSGDAAGQHGPPAQGKTLFASASKPIGQVISDGNNAHAPTYQVTVPILIDFIH